jgi:hypothetical protein
MHGPGTDCMGGDSRDRSSTHDSQKGQVLATSPKNRHGQVWVLGTAVGRAVKPEGVVEQLQHFHPTGI